MLALMLELLETAVLLEYGDRLGAKTLKKNPAEAVTGVQGWLSIESAKAASRPTKNDSCAY